MKRSTSQNNRKSKKQPHNNQKLLKRAPENPAAESSQTPSQIPKAPVKSPTLQTSFRQQRRGGMMQTGIPPEKPKDFKATFKKLIAYLHPYRLKLISVLLLASLSTLFTIFSPKVMGLAITSLFKGIMMKIQGAADVSMDYPLIFRILILLGALYLASSFFTFLMQYIMAGVAQETVYKLRKDVKSKLSRLPLNYFDTHSHGDILSRVTNDVDLISTTLQQSLTQIITSFVSLIGIVVMMMTISPILTLVTVLTLPLSIAAIKAITKRSQKYFSEQQQVIGDMNGHIEEMFTGHREVKAFNREEESLKIFDTKNQALYEVGWKAQFISGIIMPIMHAVNNLGYIIISVFGAVFVTRRMIEIGDIQAFIQYSRQFSQPIQQVASIANLIQSTIAAAERVFEILNDPEEIQDPDNPADLTKLQGRVTLEHVDFSYTPEQPLISDLNIDVQPGASIAIVGPTGAGKTTLVNLLMRFYEIQKGSITIDGIDIRQMRRGDLRNNFGMVLQDTWLFKGTIMENIAYGRDGASADDVAAMAKAAHADHFIRTLPDGYNTILNEEASNISQGQKQLLTIARAFLANPPILILDEATSSVDTRTELIIQKAMAALMKGRTNFIIAHRLSTIKDADIILVMDRGTIVEQGTHNQLLDAEGFYADLYNSQFAGKEI
jgi:ATP-binding cassette, subfamily B, multidrug efflux pump